MLDYFISHRNYKQVDTICELLNTLKHRIENQDYNDCYKEFKQAAPLFDQIKTLAICDKNEQMANAQLVFEKYFNLFCKVSEYNQLLKNKEYKSSWNTLQDCLDLAVFVGKFTDLQNRFDLPDIIQLLSKYEKLYPYNLFLSSEFIIKSAHCSICGKSMLNLDCPHIAGNIYWGEIAIRCVDEIEKFQAIALVRNPEDKRCIIESEEMQKLPESERFKKLYLFCNLNKSAIFSCKA